MAAQFPHIEWRQFHPKPVIGVDEVGRGCLAGPVFAAAVILNKDVSYPDSKSISAQKRTTLATEIMKQYQYAIATASVKEIDRINILQASLLAMKRAVLKLSVSKGHILVDGSFSIPDLSNSFKQTTIIKGDSRAAPIAAASIIAKVTRDEWICKQDQLYPQYGFASHKGYATQKHRDALKQYGSCPLHRQSFLSNKLIKNQNNKTTNKGKIAEDKALVFFKQQGWKLVARNQKIAEVEIDLIFRNQKGWLLVEVKSDNKWRRDVPMSARQKERLLQAFSYFCEQHTEPVQIQLAIVNNKKPLQVFPLESYLTSDIYS